MTVAPPNLLAARKLLLDHLDVRPARTVDADLDPAEVGIVPDHLHVGGYHCGSDRVVARDYSVIESPRDRNGLSLYASALDIGWFEVVVNGRTHNLRTFSTWLVNQCREDTPDTWDIREVIYSPDGQTVRRWDRLGRRTTGDGSHRWHTHVSYFRDATRSSRSLSGVYRRYLTGIGLIPPPPPPPAPTTADTTTRRHPTMFLIKATDDPTVYVSWGAGRAALTDYLNQMKPLRDAGMPLITVATVAELDTIGGPLRSTTGN